MVVLKNTDSPRHEFYVHQALVNELCHPLCDELQEYWVGFDGETVGRFAQYLYQAGCGHPLPIPAEATTPTSTSSGGSKHAPASPGDIGGAATNDLGEAMAPAEATQAVLLTYAKLYILSCSQGINALSDLCIFHLRRELSRISSPSADVRVFESVVGLLQYAYCSRRDVFSPEPLQPAWTELKDLVSEFCALNIETMEKHQGYTELIGEGGALAVDVMDKKMRRLKCAEAVPTGDKEATLAAEADLVKAKKVRSKKLATVSPADNVRSTGPSSGSPTPPPPPRVPPTTWGPLRVGLSFV